MGRVFFRTRRFPEVNLVQVGRLISPTQKNRRHRSIGNGGQFNVVSAMEFSPA